MATSQGITCSFVLLACLALVSGKPVVLERLSQTFLPFQFRPDGSPEFCLGEAAAEQLAYDKESKVVYVSGNKLVRVLDISDPASPTVVQTVEVPGAVSDVVYCGGYLAVTIPADPESQPGSLLVYSSYSTEKGIALLHEITTGALPDAATFTPDCKKILTANEGEAGKDLEGNFVNPEGSVTVVDLSALDEGKEGVNTIDFQFVNDDVEKFLDQGVRWSWRGQTLESGKEAQTFSKDMEPEQVVVTKDGKKAFINLQENNAVAILDMETMKIESIRGLGLKDFGKEGNGLDTSASDGGPVLREWPGLFGLLQPDVITFFNHKGEDFIVTANEGDVKEYTPEDHNITEWLEFTSGSSLVKNTTDIPEETVAALGDLASLGNLRISTEDGIAETKEDGSKIFNKLVLFGARSWSIFKASDMSLVYDSGNDLERVMAEYFPWTFNTDKPDGFCAEAPPAAETDDDDDVEEDEDEDDDEDDEDDEEDEDDATLKDTFISEEVLQDLIAEAQLDLEEFNASPDAEAEGLEEPSTALTSSPNGTADSRSKSRGPESETVKIGALGDRRLVFVTVEKGNTLFVYDVSDPSKPVWQSAIYPGARGATWAELYNRKEIVDVDPEGMDFVPAESSPTGEPLLVVSGAESGTVSIYKVTEKDGVEQDCSGGAMVEDTGKSTTVISKATGC